MSHDTITVNWKCGTCDVMHQETFNGTDGYSLKVLALVELIVDQEPGNPHLSIITTGQFGTRDETLIILSAMVVIRMIEELMP